MAKNEVIFDIDKHDTEIRADEKEKTIKEFYDKSADALMWLLCEYGEDLYLEVGNTLENDYSYIQYCYGCGQKIDWSEVNK